MLHIIHFWQWPLFWNLSCLLSSVREYSFVCGHWPFVASMIYSTKPRFFTMVYSAMTSRNISKKTSSSQICVNGQIYGSIVCFLKLPVFWWCRSRSINIFRAELCRAPCHISEKSGDKLDYSRLSPTLIWWTDISHGLHGSDWIWISCPNQRNAKKLKHLSASHTGWKYYNNLCKICFCSHPL